MLRGLQLDSMKRWSSSQLLKHLWIKEGYPKKINPHKIDKLSLVSQKTEPADTVSKSFLCLRFGRTIDEIATEHLILALFIVVDHEANKDFCHSSHKFFSRKLK